MERTTGSEFSLLLLVLAVLPGSVWLRGEALSLRCNFTITPKPSSGQPWCEIQCQVNGNTFLNYSCSGERAEPIPPLWMKVNARKAWKNLMETLKDLMDELKKILIEIKPENIIPSAAPTTSPTTTPSEATTNTAVTWTLIAIFICLLLLAS